MNHTPSSVPGTWQTYPPDICAGKSVHFLYNAKNGPIASSEELYMIYGVDGWEEGSAEMLPLVRLRTRNQLNKYGITSTGRTGKKKAKARSVLKPFVSILTL